MGRPKGSLRLGEATFLRRVVSALSAVVEDVHVIAREHGNNPEFPTVIEPPHDVAAPVFGLLAALRHAEADALVVAVDYPMITPEALSVVLSFHRQGEITAPVWGGIAQVLCAIYPSSVVKVAEQRLGRGQLDLQSLISIIPSRLIAEDELRRILSGDPFRNVNTPEDLEELRRMHEASDSSR